MVNACLGFKSVCYFCFVLETAKLFSRVSVLFYIPKCFQNPTTCLLSLTGILSIAPWPASLMFSAPNPSVCFNPPTKRSWRNEIQIGWLCLRPYNSFNIHLRKAKPLTMTLIMCQFFWLYFQLLSPSLAHYLTPHHPSQLDNSPLTLPSSFVVHISCALCPWKSLPTHLIPKILGSLFKHPSQGGLPHPPPPPPY